MNSVIITPVPKKLKIDLDIPDDFDKLTTVKKLDIKNTNLDTLTILKKMKQTRKLPIGKKEYVIKSTVFDRPETNEDYVTKYYTQKNNKRSDT